MKQFLPYQKLLCSVKHWSFFFTLSTIAGITSACSEKKERTITIHTPRELTILDEQPIPPTQLVHQAVTRSYSYDKPNDWQEQPSSSFRKLNFSFGSTGEVYLSESRGGILPNVNRWLGQFGNDPLSSIDELEQRPLLLEQGYFISTKGSFKGMKMREAVDNHKLLGALVEINGELITIKMTGSETEVNDQQSAFDTFCASLKSTK